MSGVHSVGFNRSPLTLTSAITSFKELLASPQFRDGLNIFFIGAAISASQSIAALCWNQIKHLFIAELSIREKDDAFLWVMHYFTKHVDWTRAREVEVRSRPDLKEMHTDETDAASKNGPYYFPLPSQTFTVNFRGFKIWATRRRDLVGDTSWEESLHLTFLTISNKPVKDFLQAAKEQYLAFERGKVLCYRPDRYVNWCRATMTKRSLVSLHLPGNTKERILDDVRSFLSPETQKWYADRGIPYRRGYLLYGTPGTGKSSLVHVIASELSIPIYSLSLSTKGMDDSKLQDLLDDVPHRAIVLLEDVDAAFASRSNSESSVSFSSLLNVLDGIGAPEGRIVIMTTNHRSKLDSALIRPGRIDMEIPFQNCTKDQAKSIFLRWYPDGKEDSSTEKLDSSSLASRFANDFEEDTVSVAALQGYLLVHRNNPRLAVDEVSNWLKEMMEKSGKSGQGDEDEDEDKNSPREE